MRPFDELGMTTTFAIYCLSKAWLGKRWRHDGDRFKVGNLCALQPNLLDER